MEYKVVEDKKDIIKISFKDIDQGFMTLVKDKIWEDKATELAAFKVTHPEVGELVFTLRTKGKAPKKVWNDALVRLTKDISGFEIEIKKIK
jgi:DNA-directed RNA polymerase subunit L